VIAKPHIVIRDSTIRYRHPVRGDLHAICERPGKEAWNAFRTKFASTGKARLSLRVEMVEGDQVCVEFEGVFVALH